MLYKEFIILCLCFSLTNSVLSQNYFSHSDTSDFVRHNPLYNHIKLKKKYTTIKTSLIDSILRSKTQNIPSVELTYYSKIKSLKNFKFLLDPVFIENYSLNKHLIDQLYKKNNKLFLINLFESIYNPKDSNYVSFEFFKIEKIFKANILNYGETLCVQFLMPFASNADKKRVLFVFCKDRGDFYCMNYDEFRLIQTKRLNENILAIKFDVRPNRGGQYILSYFPKCGFIPIYYRKYGE